jgi:peptide/nickel transport system permease protein
MASDSGGMREGPLVAESQVDQLGSSEGGRPRLKLLRFVVRRLALGILTLLLVSLVVFAATQALPGDAARSVLGRDVTPERLQAVREELGLDRPVPEQYWNWISGVVTGDLGTSLTSQKPISELLSDRIANSAVLVAIAALIAFPLSVLLGAITAYRRDSFFDHANSVVSVTLASLPEFVIAITLVLLFSTTVFHWFPAVSLIEPDLPIWKQLDKLVLPVLTLVIYEAPYVSRIMRASMIEILESEYIDMARLKGLSERRVLASHALPNSIIPTIQVIAVQLAVLVGGIVIVEFVFGYPGIGQGLVNAVADRDLPMVQAISLLIAGVYVIVNMLADIATILLTPRLRTAYR